MTYCFTRTDAMLLVLIIFAFTLCTANPFHKYPFVFLLDIGNEELGKANTEQIKVTVPGGIIALKYPANGNGDVIGHVRVTGIDFGVDLKANIVEGGPGYRYVVLVLMGASGTQYDAVVTIQTLEDIKLDNSTKITNNGYRVQEDDANDSAEDLMEKAEENSIYREKMNADMTQSNSNSLRYIKENMHDEDSQDASDDDNNDDIESEKADDISQLSTYSYVQKENIDIEESQENHLDSDNNYLDKINYKKQDEVDEENNEDEIDKIINNSVSNLNTDNVAVIPLKPIAGYGKYDAFKPRFYGGVVMYPQGAILQDQGNIESVIDDDYDNDYSVQFNRDKDSNNNIDVSSIDY